MKIYGFFNSMHEFGDAIGVAVAETGEVVCTHISSSESFSKYDLNKPHIFDERFPNGWDYEFVKIPDRDQHKGLQDALKLHEVLNP